MSFRASARVPMWSGGVHLIGMYKPDGALTGRRLVRVKDLRDLELSTQGRSLPPKCLNKGVKLPECS